MPNRMLTQKEAARLFGVSLHEFTNYCGETGNDKHITAALSNPGVVFGRPLDDYHAPYLPAVVTPYRSYRTKAAKENTGENMPASPQESVG